MSRGAGGRSSAIISPAQAAARGVTETLEAELRDEIVLVPEAFDPRREAETRIGDPRERLHRRRAVGEAVELELADVVRGEIGTWLRLRDFPIGLPVWTASTIR